MLLALSELVYTRALTGPVYPRQIGAFFPRVPFGLASFRFFPTG